MFMEEIITKLASGPQLFAGEDGKFIRSISNRIQNGEALTTRQGYRLIRVLNDNNHCRFELGLTDSQFQNALQHPEWQTPLKQSVWLTNEVRYLGNDVLGFRCSSNQTMNAQLRVMKGQFYGGVTLVRVRKTSMLLRVIEFIGNFHFSLDSETEQYLAGALTGRSLGASAALWQDQIVIDVPDDCLLSAFMVSTMRASAI